MHGIHAPKRYGPQHAGAICEEPSALADRMRADQWTALTHDTGKQPVGYYEKPSIVTRHITGRKCVRTRAGAATNPTGSAQQPA